MIIAKALGVRYPRYHALGGVKPQNDVNLIAIDDINNVKSIIQKLLFMEKVDYVLVGINKKMFICERHDDTQYSRTDCQYHPYQKLVDA